MGPAATKFSVGAVLGTLTAIVAIWRDRRHEAARERDLETFVTLISSMPTEDLTRLRSDYSTLAAFDNNPQFRRKRDACNAELARRAPDAPLTAGTQPPRRSVSMWRD